MKSIKGKVVNKIIDIYTSDGSPYADTLGALYRIRCETFSIFFTTDGGVYLFSIPNDDGTNLSRVKKGTLSLEKAIRKKKKRYNGTYKFTDSNGLTLFADGIKKLDSTEVFELLLNKKIPEDIWERAGLSELK